mgnify:CR=1 FL=1
MVKRLIGLGGDHIRIEKGIVSVNGVEIQEPYIGSRLDYTGSFVVPKGKYFVLGDSPISNVGIILPLGITPNVKISGSTNKNKDTITKTQTTMMN